MTVNWLLDVTPPGGFIESRPTACPRSLHAASQGTVVHGPEPRRASRRADQRGPHLRRRESLTRAFVERCPGGNQELRGDVLRSGRANAIGVLALDRRGFARI